MTNKKLKVQHVPIDQLKEADYNPRTISPKQYEELKTSLKDFDLLEPLIANLHKGRENVLCGGHMRLRVLKDLGYKTVPVVFVDLTETKEKELNLRLNKSGGDWNYELLKEFDVELLLNTGFTDEDLSIIWDENLSIEDDDFDEEAEIEKAKQTKVKLGDLYQLGNHYVLCDDSTELDNVKRLVGKHKIDLINTDIPYNIGLDYNRGLGGKKAYGGKVNDKKSDKDYRLFVKTLIQNSLTVSNPDAHIFFWLDEKYIGMMQELYKECGISEKRLLSWIKDNQNPTPQIAFNKITEVCLYGITGKPYLSDKVKNLHEIMNKEVTTGARVIDDVLDIINIWLVKRLPSTQYEHPTSKNPTVYEKSLRRCSKPGDKIIDLCGGSGSLLIACEQLNRQAFICEISPIFIQLIINRYEKLTGQKAKKLN